MLEVKRSEVDFNRSGLEFSLKSGQQLLTKFKSLFPKPAAYINVFLSIHVDLDVSHVPQEGAVQKGSNKKASSENKVFHPGEPESLENRVLYPGEPYVEASLPRVVLDVQNMNLKFWLLLMQLLFFEGAIFDVLPEVYCTFGLCSHEEIHDGIETTVQTGGECQTDNNGEVGCVVCARSLGVRF
jgi:hypothetical protein